jgi:hypothetical protein
VDDRDRIGGIVVGLRWGLGLGLGLGLERYLLPIPLRDRIPGSGDASRTAESHSQRPVRQCSSTPSSFHTIHSLSRVIPVSQVESERVNRVSLAGLADLASLPRLRVVENRDAPAILQHDHR